MKFCMRLPKHHSQYPLELSLIYIPAHILGTYQYNLVVYFPISNARLFFEQVCYFFSVSFSIFSPKELTP